MIKLLLEFDNFPFFKVKKTNDENIIKFEHNTSHNFEYTRFTEMTLEPDPEFVEYSANPDNRVSYGRIVIDGEPFNVQKITCKVLPNVLEIFCP